MADGKSFKSHLKTKNDDSKVNSFNINENKAPKKREKQKKDKVLCIDNSKAVPFTVVEAYKNIRVQLIAMMEKKGCKTIAISSANASEGKSTTSLNIAITFSQLNKKVIIVDADIRRGTIHLKAKLNNDIGCTDVLAGDVAFEDAVKHYRNNLDVLTCGKLSSNSCELFDSTAFDILLKKLNETYDYVIFDTPPVTLVSDTLVIAKKCDGLVYVVRSAVTTFEAFKRAKSSTEKLGANTLGVILNGVDLNSTKSYKYKYNKYGSYNYGPYGYYGRRNR